LAAAGAVAAVVTAALRSFSQRWLERSMRDGRRSRAGEPHLRRIGLALCRALRILVRRPTIGRTAGGSKIKTVGA